MLAIDPQALSDSELDHLIDNHRRHDKAHAELYLAALAERARRRGKRLSFEKSFDLIRAAAREGRYSRFKELADASAARLLGHSVADGAQLLRDQQTEVFA